MTACPSCQNPVPPAGIRFCIHCGTELVPEKTVPLPAPDDLENGVSEEDVRGVLIGFKPTGERTTFQLDQVESSIGKAPHNRIVLDDPTVSASHALVRFDREAGGAYHLLDLASRNGTYVNGRRLSNQTHPLRHGDRIQIGQVMLAFRLPHGDGDGAATTSLSPAPVPPLERPRPVSGQPFERTITVNLPREIRQAVEAGRPEPVARRLSSRRPVNYRMKAALLNSTSRIVSTLLGAALTIGLALYLTREVQLPVRQTPPIPTSPTVSIVAEGTWTRLDTGFLEDDFEASGVTSRPGAGGLLLTGERHDDRLFWLELDETGLQVGPLTPVPVTIPGAPTSALHDAEALTYGNGFCYLLSSQSDPIDPRQHRLLRFEFDPLQRQIGSLETIESLRERLLNSIPEITTLGARPGSVGGLNAEGLAWDPNQERLLLGLRSPLIGDQALLIPLRLREPRGLFAAENLELPAPALILLPLGGQGIRDITYDARLKSFLILSGPPENRPTGDFSLWEWNGRNETRPRRLLVLEPGMQPEGLVSLTIRNRDLIIVTGNGGHYLKLGYRED